MMASDTASESACLTIHISHRKHNYDFHFDEDATVNDLFEEIEASLDIPITNQKILVPKAPMLKAPAKDPHMSLRGLQGKTLTLMGTSASEVQAVDQMCERVAKRNVARMAQRAKSKLFPQRNQSRSTEDSTYTFLQVRPLQGLPHPERSEKLLHKLKEDPGIRTVMRNHKFTVSLLTEMEPLSNTQSNHEGTSRLLGLNRNQGEVIELRLRTDAYDGYRDYKTIRKTLVHELTHNVHSAHDRQFWDLCNKLEKEVQAADWKHGGRTVGESSHYVTSGEADDDEGVHEDHGGWSGGEFVLGGVKTESTVGMSRREILANAAQERQRRETGAERKACDAAAKGWRPCQRPQRSDESKSPPR